MVKGTFIDLERHQLFCLGVEGFHVVEVGGEGGDAVGFGGHGGGWLVEVRREVREMKHKMSNNINNNSDRISFNIVPYSTYNPERNSHLLLFQL